MKKQIKKLNLSKRTISNLNTSEMSQKAGGAPTNGRCSGNCTNNHTCGFGSRCGSSYAEV